MKKISAWIIAHDWVAIPLVLLAAIVMSLMIGLWFKLLVAAYELGWNIL